MTSRRAIYFAVLIGLAFLPACQRKTENMSLQNPLPDPFEMTIARITQHPSFEGATLTSKNRHSFSNLADVQNHLRTLEWQNPNVLFEIEIIRRQSQSSESKLEIKQLAQTDDTFELAYFEDNLTRPDSFVGAKISDLNGRAAEILPNYADMYFSQDNDVAKGDAK